VNNIATSTMTFSDFELISEDLSTKFDDFWKASILKSELENENSICIVAKQNDEIVGFASIWNAVYDIHITNIVVRKDLRKQGIGTLLLEKLIKITKKMDNINSITLEVKTTNKPAINLYSKYGFEKVGLRKKYYNNTDDAIIMTLNLI
jgi:ribosomal-protein-alanine N-acetyltransferase